eukprot:TRINITY_DN34433_c0_g1_i1.p1 TRINITY_DN34433_c0_g1~~TRINITY_DN34433_c0_g1_i1.p1  ORF type:complete len:757 (+),score=107.30 TRINITY_DN34433_c0_g1_i1:67-2337(+)
MHATFNSVSGDGSQPLHVELQPSAPPQQRFDSHNGVEGFLLNRGKGTPVAPIITVHNYESRSSACLESLKIHVDIQLATAFVTFKGLARIPDNHPASLTRWKLLTPMSEEATMLSCSIHINPGRRGQSPESYFETVVADNDAAAEPINNTSNAGISRDDDPFMSKVPFDALPFDYVEFTTSYMEPLVYDHSTSLYTLGVPLLGCTNRFAPKLQPGVTLSEIVYVTCHLNGYGIQYQPNTSSIPLNKIAGASNNSQWLQSVPGRWEGKDLFVSYMVKKAEMITGCCLVEDSSMNVTVPRGVPVWSVENAQTCKNFNPYPDHSNFAILLNPPVKPAGQTGHYARNFVYLLDISASMNGSRLLAAKKALCTALDDLNPATRDFPGDKFAIILFNHAMQIFSQLQIASTENVVAAKTGLLHVSANGATEISKPLQEAFNMLDNSAGALPFIVLVTDGCVHNEPQIVKKTTERYTALAQKGVSLVPRILTFGIGSNCNRYFLKMLATIGRGHSSMEHATNEGAVAWKMQRLILTATGPVLTNIVVKDQNGAELQAEMTPYPVPDLTCGAPVVVSGRVPIHNLPNTVEVQGMLWDGSPFSMSFIPERTHCPIQKVFTRLHLEALIARMWMERTLGSSAQADILQRDTVLLSTSTGVPCDVTRVVSVPMTPQQNKQYHEKRDQSRSQEAMADVVSTSICELSNYLVVCAFENLDVIFGQADVLTTEVLSALADTVDKGGDSGSGCSFSCCSCSCGSCGSCGSC